MPRTSTDMDRITTLLYRVWKEHPDYRFGQLVENVLIRHRGEGFDHCIYHVEDDVLEHALRGQLDETA